MRPCFTGHYKNEYSNIIFLNTDYSLLYLNSKHLDVIETTNVNLDTHSPFSLLGVGIERNIGRL